MSADRAPGTSLAKTWATILGFLAALLLVLGLVAYGVGRIAHANGPHKPAPSSQTEARR